FSRNYRFAFSTVLLFSVSLGFTWNGCFCFHEATPHKARLTALHGVAMGELCHGNRNIPSSGMQKK
ncbi:hypothetical protein, partial [uncultured Ruminococcus sp.]|uniref:hypothetical protein n=1 Tax=uncultured Ruminococcus sp. TaxID=165186 RepID=UPI002674F3DF